jgi:Subtilase family
VEPAAAARFSLVEARPAATPFLRLTGARDLSPAIGLWRVRTSELGELQRAGLVRAAEPVRHLRPDATAIDPLLPEEWWLAPVGSSSVAEPGAGVPVAVIDTGLDFTHPEFSQRPNTTSLNTQSVVDSLEDYHGTAVASVIGAPANDVGMVGVYPQASLYAYDADLGGSLTTDALISGISAAAALGRVVINLSLGSSSRDPLLDDALLAAFRSGALIVAAAGNGGTSGQPNYPADLPHILTVAATDQSGFAARFSSVSASVDLAAPGTGITAAVPYRYTVDGYQLLNGTSLSTPIVSGAAALVWTVRSKLDNTQLFALLRSSAHDIAPRGFDPATGYGMLDISAALAHAAPNPDSPEPNDDIRLVEPGGLFASGMQPLTTKTRRAALARGSVDAIEDPADVYRIWVPAHGVVSLRASNSRVGLRLWRPAARTVAELGRTAARDLAAVGLRRITAVNASKRAGYWYADVSFGRKVGNTRYELTVRTTVPAKR